MSFDGFVFTEKDLFSEDDSYEVLSYVMVAPDGNLLAFTGTRFDNARLFKPRIVRSTDNGENWTEVEDFSELTSETLTENPILLSDNVFVDSDDGNIYVFLFKYGEYGAGTEDVWIYKSEDNGATWTPHVTSTVTNRGGMLMFFRDLGDGIWLGIWQISGSKISICESTDQGTNWTEKSSITTSAYPIDVVVFDDCIILADDGKRLYKSSISTPYTFTKTCDDIGDCIKAHGCLIARNKTTDGKIIILNDDTYASEVKLIVSEDSGDTWTITTPTGLVSEGGAFFPFVLGNQVLAMDAEVSQGYIYGSDDFGATFTQLQTMPEYNYGMGIFQGADNSLWVGMDWPPDAYYVEYPEEEPETTLFLRYANEALDIDEYFWKAKLTRNFELETLFEVSEKFGSQKRSVQISLDNRDLELTQVHESYSLLNKPVVLYYDDPSGTTKTFYGVVTELNKMGLDVELTVSEELSLYMQQPLPDLQVAIDYYSDKGINENWNAVPIIIGNVKRLKTQWTDLVFSRYVIGSGPLASIDKVYFDDVIMYDKTRTSAENIFQTSDNSKKVGVIIWRGTGWESDPETQLHPITGETITSVYPGVAYLEFYNPDATSYGNPSAESSPPMNADGSACEVYVDVQGISDPDSEPDAPTPERNPAKILYQLATNPRTSNDHAGFEAADKGPRGFGLAISTDKIDFTDAISFCTANSIVIDGVIAQKLEASEWFDELAKYCMATFKEIDGKLTLVVDDAATTVKAHFSDDGTNAYNCIIGDYKEPSYDKQINRIRLYYGYNVETGKFDKRPYGSEESPIPENSQYLRNESHYLKLLKWNTENFEYKFVQDDTTAHKIAQYNFKRNILQLKTVDITCGFDIVDLDVLDVISITSTKHIWTRKQFRIKKIVRSDKGIKLTCQEYDSNVYTDECSGEITIQDPNYPETPRPDKCILDSLQSVPTLSSDGTTDINLTLEFTPPSNNFVTAEIYYKPYTAGDPSPNEGYTYWASTSTSPYTKKWVNSLGKYRFRLVSVSPTGSKSFIKIESTDLHYYGQPGSETYLEISGDDTAPGKPTISNVTPLPYGIVFTISISGGTPADFDHFKIYRKITRGIDPQYEVINDNVKTFLYTDINNDALPYDTDIQYQAIAYDKTGNPSEISDEHTAVQVKYVVGDDITAEQIIGKDFRTATDVGESLCGVYCAGVKFDSYGILGYDTSGKTFELSNNGTLWLKGTIQASDGCIGGWCIDTDCLYATTTGTIATGQNIGYAQNGIILDCAGIRGYDSVLGITFNIPTDGSAPCFASGVIKSTVFELQTAAVIRTSEYALIGCCGVGCAGILINDTGIYASDCTTIGVENALVRILNDGTLYLGGSTPKLSWDGTDLTISGTICADAGNIARWCIEDIGGDTSRIYSSNTCCDSDLTTVMSIYSQYCDGTNSGYPLIRMQIGTTINTSHHLSIGQMAWGNNNQDAFGFSIGLIKDCEGPTFAVGKALFGDVSIPDGECDVPQGETFFWVGNSTNYMRWRSDCNELKVSGTIYSSNATITGLGRFGEWELYCEYFHSSSFIGGVGNYTDVCSNLSSQFVNQISRLYCCDDDSLMCAYSSTLTSTSLAIVTYDICYNETKGVHIGPGYAKFSFLGGYGNRAVYSDADGYLTNTSSDCRLKCNIIPITKSLNIKDIINGLNGIYFNWVENKFGEQKEIGLIAQEVQSIIPEAVGTNNDGYLSLDYSRLIPVLIEAQKDIYSKIKNIEEKLNV